MQVGGDFVTDRGTFGENTKRLLVSFQEIMKINYDVPIIATDEDTGNTLLSSKGCTA